MVKIQLTRRREIFMLCAGLFCALLIALSIGNESYAMSSLEVNAGSIVSTQASNDATTVTYQLGYSGSFTYYRVYLDTDQNTTTGFRSYAIGANYLLENGTLFRYNGTGTNWSWAKVKTVTYTNAAGIAKWVVNRADIGESTTPNQADLVFQGESPIVTSGKLTHTYSTSTPTPTPTLTPTPVANSATVNYASTTALFANPERGFYRYKESRSSALNVWTVADLTSTNAVSWLTASEEATITQMYCIFYLDTFLRSNISSSFLDHIRANLSTIRSAGKKCILRFAYSENDADNNGNGVPDILENANLDTEPDLPQILTHIDQLRPTLQEYADVITVMQAGFIGLWGEWYYTDHFVDTPSQPDIISATQYERRKAVVQKLLDTLPATRMVAVRYPDLKKKMFGRTTPITAAEAFANSAIARVGFHNDAFLNAYGDGGTFLSQADRTYLQAESNYLSMGGEVNSPESGAPSRSCTNAVSEMATYHWSYINTDYYIPTLSSWKNGGCIHNTANIPGSILDRLGYRFVLKQGIYPLAATAGGSMTVCITLANEGFAAPYNPRSVVLILQNKLTGAIYKAPLAVDPRLWLANGQNYTMVAQANLPATMPAGSYSLMLNLPDAAANLATNVAYSIRFANASTWKTGTGYNDLLHTITVNAVAAAGETVPEALPEHAEIVTFVADGFFPPDADLTALETSEETEEVEANSQIFLPLVANQ